MIPGRCRPGTVRCVRVRVRCLNFWPTVLSVWNSSSQCHHLALQHDIFHTWDHSHRSWSKRKAQSHRGAKELLSPTGPDAGRMRSSSSSLLLLIACWWIIVVITTRGSAGWRRQLPPCLEHPSPLSPTDYITRSSHGYLAPKGTSRGIQHDEFTLGGYY